MEATEPGGQSSVLLQMPAEVVVVHIAQWLSVRELARLSTLCHQLHDLLSHDSVWHKAAERYLGVPRGSPLPPHHDSWRSLCARLHKFKAAQPQPTEWTSTEERATSMKPFRAFRVEADELRGMSNVTTLTFWMLMADNREREEAQPLVFIARDSTALVPSPTPGTDGAATAGATTRATVDEMAVVLAPESACLAVVERHPIVALPPRGVRRLVPEDDDNTSSGEDNESSDEDDDDGNARGSFFGGITQSRSREWLVRVDTESALPILTWTLVSVTIRWHEASMTSTSVAARAQGSHSWSQSHSSKDAAFDVHFGSEEVSFRPQQSGSRFFFFSAQRRPRFIEVEDEEHFNHSRVRDVRVYDGELPAEDLAFLASLAPPLPEDMARIEAEFMSSISSVRHSSVTCDGCNMHPLTGLRYKCAESCNFDLCKSCYDTGINPTHLPVSPDHEPSHRFNVIQTSGFSSIGFLVPPPRTSTPQQKP